MSLRADSHAQGNLYHTSFSSLSSVVLFHQTPSHPNHMWLAKCFLVLFSRRADISDALLVTPIHVFCLACCLLLPALTAKHQRPTGSCLSLRAAALTCRRKTCWNGKTSTKRNNGGGSLSAVSLHFSWKFASKNNNKEIKALVPCSHQVIWCQ